MGHLREALQAGIDGTATPQEQGRQFERALRQAMRVHPAEWGKSRFEDVWLWRDWPQRQRFGYRGTDIGIDLVAKANRDWGDGGYVAIQAKYGLSPVQTREVRSFLAASSNINAFSERILVADRHISSVGESLIEKANPRCQLLSIGEIDSWVGDWREFIPDHIDDISITFPKHELRPYQEEALNAITHTFLNHDRARMILPCGTGKSFVALKVAERSAGIGTTVLYLVPSISLMGQTMREWSRHRTIEHQYIGICSDVTTGEDPDAKENYARGQFSELYMPVTTNIERISEALARNVPSDKMRVVFSTYQSSIKIRDALKREELKGFRFSLVSVRK